MDFIPREYEPSNFSTLSDIVGLGINIILGAAMAISFIGVILAGIKYMSTRSGDPRSLEGARKALTYSIVGMILSVTAFAILNIILNLIGGSTVDVFGT